MQSRIDSSDGVPMTGYVPGIPRLGIPPLHETNGSLGIAPPGDRGPADQATPLPSGLAVDASWEPRLAYAHGAVIGDEAQRKDFNVVLCGGVNLARDPRNGRNFEYAGEDPLLAGTMVGAAIRGIEDQQVITTIKHFALNDVETGRTVPISTMPRTRGLDQFGRPVIRKTAGKPPDQVDRSVGAQQHRPGVRDHAAAIAIFSEPAPRCTYPV